MRKAEIVLRKIIREELINEVPAAGSAPLTPFPQHWTQPKPDGEPLYSVGYRDADKNRPDFIKRFSRTPDNWDIIPVENVRDLDRLVEDEDFQAEIISRHYPPGTKILVVGTRPYESDYTETKWAIQHDIIGHTIDKWLTSGYFRTHYGDGEYRNDIIKHASEEESSEFFARYSFDEEKSPEYAIWRSLPSENQLGGEADIISDIYAAIFFDDIMLADIVSVVRRYLTSQFPSIPQEKVSEMAMKHGEELVARVVQWKKSIHPGINIVYLW